MTPGPPRPPSAAGGYILAGGRSSRMGRDKALLALAGRPLIQHAVTKLRRVCADVRILTADPALESYAPILPDLHPGCGPIGGVEAALTHSAFDWSLILPVDMPFLPAAFLDRWVRATLREQPRGARIAIFTVDGVAQPALALLHRQVLPFVSRAIQQDQFKLLPLLEHAGRELAAQLNVPLEHALRNLPWNPGSESPPPSGLDALPPAQQQLETPAHLQLETPAQQQLETPAQQQARHLWFANLNTPQEFADAERHHEALDP